MIWSLRQILQKRHFQNAINFVCDQRLCVTKLFSRILTHFKALLFFYTHWKHWKVSFSDVFRGYRKRKLACNGWSLWKFYPTWPHTVNILLEEHWFHHFSCRFTEPVKTLRRLLTDLHSQFMRPSKRIW